MRETWKPVPACRWFGISGGMLAASSEGRVRTHAGRVLTPVPDPDGYPRVKFYRRWFAVHVLVCLAFQGPPEVLHGDGDRANARPGNLRWGSRRENQRDKSRHKAMKEGGVSPPSTAVTPVTGDLLG